MMDAACRIINVAAILRHEMLGLSSGPSSLFLRSLISSSLSFYFYFMLQLVKKGLKLLPLSCPAWQELTPPLSAGQS